MITKGTTRAQRTFLRALHDNPGSPPPELWPSPAILRRWLRRRPFRQALRTIRDALAFQAEFNFAAAASDAALRLSSARSKPLPHQDLRALTQLLRLHHAKRRFPVYELKLDTPASFELRDALLEARGQDPDDLPDPMETLIDQMLSKPDQPLSTPSGPTPENCKPQAPDSTILSPEATPGSDRRCPQPIGKES